MSIANTEDVNYAAENASRIACQMVELALREISAELQDCGGNMHLTPWDIGVILERVADRISAKLKESSEKPQPKHTDRHWQCHREGQDANDHNRRVYRKPPGELKHNPYEVNSTDWKSWNDGYAYRDMVNDG